MPKAAPSGKRTRQMLRKQTEMLRKESEMLSKEREMLSKESEILTEQNNRISSLISSLKSQRNSIPLVRNQGNQLTDLINKAASLVNDLESKKIELDALGAELRKEKGIQLISAQVVGPIDGRRVRVATDQSPTLFTIGNEYYFYRGPYKRSLFKSSLFDRFRFLSGQENRFSSGESPSLPAGPLDAAS
jgi:predicted RNase H-like nuclease (RuvC/YqgF family)